MHVHVNIYLIFIFLNSFQTIKMGNRDINDSSLERPGVLKDVKVVIVGSAKCGKTALVQRFVNDTFYDVSKLCYNS